MKRLVLSLAAISALAIASCSSADSGGASDGTGGASEDAGATASGGSSGTGGKLGTGGSASTGGSQGSSGGGAAATGGAAASGGKTGSGGASASGGQPAGSGGVIGSGGVAPGTGGAGGRGTATGGAGGRATASGGVSAGGSGIGGMGTGGVPTSSGGSSGTGGAPGNLPPGVTGLFPGPGAASVCPDPPLRITFSGAPTLGTTGKIQVFNSSGTSVASVDMATSTVTDTIGGTAFVLLRPAYVDGNSAVIYLKTKALAYGQTYYVNVDSGAIKPPGGATFAITGSTAWRFTTASAAPSNLAAMTVALDGSGAFCTVQGATDALPANNTAASVITINSGTYHELMHVSKKSNITLHGQDRAQTMIVGTNNNTQQANNPNGAGTSNRSLLGFDSTNGLVIENLTIKNLTPQDGSQAEALRLQNCDKCVIRDADIWSLQDTLLWSGRVYADNCLIAGNVDYIWGTGVAYFNKCEIRTVGRSGVLVQSRNGTGAYGYVFVDSKLTVDAVSKNNMLARIDVSAYPGSHVAYINCQMTGIAAAGWTITGGTATSSLRFWEYQSTDASGNLLSTSGRVGGTQISSSQATMMRDPTVVLGGWQP
jgi:pectin methylesterase-like acyl-CoA thioesterase